MFILITRSGQGKIGEVQSYRTAPLVVPQLRRHAGLDELIVSGTCFRHTVDEGLGVRSDGRIGEESCSRLAH